MFRGKIYYLTLVFLVPAIYMVWIFYTPSSRNYRDYRKLMAYSDGGNREEDTQTLARQKRERVSKQFVFNRGNHRLEWRMKSLNSEVCLEQTDSSLQLVESLHGMTCLMQEDPPAEKSGCSNHEPYRLLRCVEAENAVYQYKNRQLTAEKVFLKRYKIPGTIWVESLSPFSPFMQGNAQEILLDFSQDPSFKARGFQAIFRDWE